MTVIRLLHNPLGEEVCFMYVCVCVCVCICTLQRAHTQAHTLQRTHTQAHTLQRTHTGYMVGDHVRMCMCACARARACVYFLCLHALECACLLGVQFFLDADKLIIGIKKTKNIFLLNLFATFCSPAAERRRSVGVCACVCMRWSVCACVRALGVCVPVCVRWECVCAWTLHGLTLPRGSGSRALCS